MKDLVGLRIVAFPAARPSRVAPAVDCVYVAEDAPGHTLEFEGPVVLGIRLAPVRREERATW